MSERWKAIPGYEGRYEASDMGRIRSLDRIATLVDGRTRKQRGRILRPTKRRYWCVCLSEVRPRKFATVHSLVLAAFVGPRPEGMVGRHLDDNRDDNGLANLAYGTQSDNMLDSVRNGTHGSLKQGRDAA
ncbi:MULTISPECIES: NUMOD4 motif-containing HNH endonuclease [unclassified Microbacterium]|uniref:NUMOD4 motif-containing HNH endonuclease n=1 Tax=unclassified Microbacterium TaxID=2609290 RepID=UPI000EA93BCD|nr:MULTISPECIES: NUMOD4 motif-containing HNH endonuclease [unclassified Microbacterium]MBT2485796.1 NUMOD4 motif-containing HNH endonuclease [Microbacterium sp. ISL-108]RKN68558.1 hypothetical protein D7252_13850 [Microbacterium sp. CGR2]